MLLRLAPKCSVWVLVTSRDACTSKGGLAKVMAGIYYLLFITHSYISHDTVTTISTPFRVSFSTLSAVNWRLGWGLAGTDLVYSLPWDL